MSMTIKYDAVADAVYLSLIEGVVASTLKVNDRLMMDLDAQGNTLGLEILDASTQEELVQNLRKNAESGIPVSIEVAMPTTI